MRLDQQIRAVAARPALMGAAALLFVSGLPLSASGQPRPAQPPAAAAAPVVQGSPLSIDEAVRMALENNLGIQIEKLNPQIQVLGVARANAVYAPAVFSVLSRRSATNPPTDFLASGAVTAAVSTNTSFVTQGGVQQTLRWGGNYTVAFDGTRATTNAATAFFNPQIGSDLNASFTQPLLRNFRIDAFRQQVLQAKNQQDTADIQLQQRITQTSRNVRAAYYSLIGSIAGLEVAQTSLDLARQSLKNNQTRVEVGTMAPIDITAAEAEVASNEEAVIVQQAAIESAQDLLRTLVMNPKQPEFWSARFAPTEQPVLTAQAIDVEAAIKSALEHRTDLLAFKKSMESTDISLAYARNQKLPAVDLTARYGLTGVGGTQFDLDRSTFPPTIRSQSNRSFADAIRDVFGNDFRTWSFAVNVSYPLGTSIADAAYAQAKITKQQEQTTLAAFEMQVTTAVREAGRQVTTNLRRVEATRRARDLAQKRLDAENKRFTVGLSTQFELFQAQRDLARARQAELNATIAYNQSLVDFEAVQIAPLR